jgi:hypothetical protein
VPTCAEELAGNCPPLYTALSTVLEKVSLTGRTLWHNPLTGYGMGAPTSLASVRGQSSTTLIQQAADAASKRDYPHQTFP